MRPIAIWNSARDVWETPRTEGLFCEHLDVYSETFPTSGMTLNGAAYELPTWEPATDVSASSSLLRTVIAEESAGGPISPAMAKRKGQTLRLSGQIVDLVNPGQLPQPQLLQTPSVADALGGHERRGGKRSSELLLNGQAKELAKLLPSPRASEGEKGGPNMRGSKGDLMLSSAVHRLTGESTSPPSDAGKQLWEDVPLPLPSQLDATTATD